jgi:hypothetical protein
MGRPHRTKSLRLESSVVSSADAATVIRHVRTPRTWPAWQSEILGVEGPELVDEGDVVHGDARLLGFDVDGRSDALFADDSRFEEEVIVGVRMRIAYEARPTSTGSVITHRMYADLPTGLAGSVLSLLLGWRLKRMQTRLLAALRDQVGPMPPDAEPS